MFRLILVVHLDDNHSDVLIVCIVGNLGDVPVAREEDEELVGGAVVETGTRFVVIVVDDVWTILAIWLAGKMVDDAKALHTLYHILEVDVVVMAFAAALLQWVVLAVLNADGEVRAWNRVLAARDGEQVGLGDEVEE